MDQILPFGQTRRPTPLYGMSLNRTAAGDAESLYSYMLRLAFAHRVTPKTLSQSCVEHTHERQFGRRLNATYLSAAGAMVLSNCRTAEAVVDVLTSLTGVPDLERGTALFLGSLVSTQGLISEQDRVCLSCVREDQERTGETFGRLLWRIACVNCCPIHGETLTRIAECPRTTTTTSQHRAVKIYGVCDSCASIGYRCQPSAGAGTEEEKRMARLCRDLLGARPIMDIVSVRAAKSSLKRAAGQMNGGYAAVARSANLPKSTLARWFNDDSARIQLRAIISVCMALGISAEEFARGDFASVPTTPVRTVAWARQSKRKLATAELEAALFDALRQPNKIVAEVARELKVDKKMLRRANPKAYNALSSRGAATRAQRKKDQWDEAIQEAQSMLRELRGIGKVPSLKNASSACGSVWLPSQPRSRIIQSLAKSDLHRLARLRECPAHIVDTVRTILQAPS